MERKFSIASITEPFKYGHTIHNDIHKTFSVLEKAEMFGITEFHKRLEKFSNNGGEKPTGFLILAETKIPTRNRYEYRWYWHIPPNRFGLKVWLDTFDPIK